LEEVITDTIVCLIGNLEVQSHAVSGIPTNPVKDRKLVYNHIPNQRKEICEGLFWNYVGA
jgi:hypothetical protein